MKSIAQFTGKLPFSGKHLAKKWFMDGVSDARHGETGAKLLNAGALLGFASLHAVQMKLGISELATEKSASSLEVGIDAGYTAVNALVTYTQVYLAARVLTTDTNPRLSPESQSVNHRLEPVTALELGVTLGGQLLFMTTMH